MQTRQKSVLIVEDCSEVRDVLTDLLQDAGYEVAEAANGQEGLERLQGLPLPDLIVLDLMMPVMDGWEFRRPQRESPQLAPVPVVVLSGAGDAARHASELEATAYFDKPVNVAALLAAIARHCP